MIIPFQLPDLLRSKQNANLFLAFTIALLLLSCKKDKQTADDPISRLATCQETAARGRLVRNSAEQYTYISSGGVKIEVHTVRGIVISNPEWGNFQLDLWGEIVDEGRARTRANHENLNGKHLKDKLGRNRSFIFPDGTKLTLNSQEGATWYERLTGLSIIDGNQVHHINPWCNTIEISLDNASLAQQLDDAIPDGETSAIEVTGQDLLLVTVYNEASSGNKVPERTRLGGVNFTRPNEVNDYFDDPRMGHT